MTTPIKYRISSTATKPVSDTVKGAPLTSLEIDGNFRSIKDSIELIQSAYLPAGYSAPVDYVAGVVLSSATQTVAYQGEVYAPKAAEVPFTTSGTFEVTKFVQIQSVAGVDLAATDGASLVGYDGGTVQDVLDGAKSMQSYTELRAYTGRAKRVYITGILVTAKPAGIAGVFQYDPTDTTSSDNGGTIIVDANSRRWKRDFSGSVNIRWFGCDPTGTVDCTEQIQAAIDFLRSIRTSPPGYSGWGVGALYAPDGKYLVNGTLTVNAAIGMLFYGDGEYATSIVTTNDSGILFDMNLYISFKVENLSIIHNTLTDKSTWTNTCFSLSGAGGGRNFKLSNVSTLKFGTLIKCEGVVNEDTTYAEHCTFDSCNIFYDSLNSQGILNNFSNCTWGGTIQYVFYVAGGWQTLIDTGNVVIDGTFIKLRDVAAKYNARGFTIINTKFEWTDSNKVLGSAPKIIDANGSFIGANITMIDCGIQGGPTPSSDARWGFFSSGGLNVNIYNGAYTGKLEVKNITGNLLNRANRIYIERSEISPSSVIFTDSGASGASYPNINFTDCKDSIGVPINITLCKSPSTPWSNPSRVVAFHIPTLSFDAFYAGTSNVDYPTYGQPVWVNSVKFFSRTGTGASQVINVYSDSAKTILIGTVTLPASGSISNKMHTVALASNLVTEGIYLQLVTSNNVGGHFILDFTSV